MTPTSFLCSITITAGADMLNIILLATKHANKTSNGRHFAWISKTQALPVVAGTI